MLANRQIFIYKVCVSSFSDKLSKRGDLYDDVIGPVQVIKKTTVINDRQDAQRATVSSESCCEGLLDSSKWKDCGHVMLNVLCLLTSLSSWRNKNKRSNLQTFSSACPCCHGLACPRAHPQSCSWSSCPGDRLQRCSCAGRPLVPWSGKRATGSVGGLQRTHCAWVHLHLPCHPPNATVLLEVERNHKDKWCD